MLITVLVPVLNRPQNAAPVLESLRNSTRFRKDVELIFLCSPKDAAEENACRRVTLRDVNSAGGHSGVITVGYPATDGHDYARKMNIGVAASDSEWLLLGSDDITFEPGWEVDALKVAEETGKRVIGTNDKANKLVSQKGLFSTHTLVARSYVEDPGASLDGPGTIVSEAYQHNFVDRELAGLAMFRDEWAMAPNAIIRHRHPAFGTAPQDATYEKGRDTFFDDQLIFWERAAGWEMKGLLPQELSLIDRSARRNRRVSATARARRERG